MNFRCFRVQYFTAQIIDSFCAGNLFRFSGDCSVGEIMGELKQINYKGCKDSLEKYSP